MMVVGKSQDALYPPCGSTPSLPVLHSLPSTTACLLQQVPPCLEPSYALLLVPGILPPEPF